MLYPIRLIRRRKDIACAKVRLAAAHKLHYLERINKKRYPQQPHRIAPRHVSFTGHTKVVQYDRTAFPVLNVVKKPSTLHTLPEDTIQAIAKDLNIKPSGKSSSAIQTRIQAEWIARIRKSLSDIGILTQAVKDGDIEDFYNLVIGLKRAANLLLAGVEMVPRAMTLEQLQAFMRLHSLYVPPNASHLWCTRSVETYLQDHIDPIETPVSDIARRRMSAENVFGLKYCMSTLKGLQEELRSRGIHAPKTIQMCKTLLLDVIQQDLSAAFSNALESIVDTSLESLGKSEKESSLSNKVLRLFRVLKEEKVCIPSDYECSVCCRFRHTVFSRVTCLSEIGMELEPSNE